MVKDWRDLPDESTPILASELERIETDIESAANAAGAAVSTAAGFSGRVATAEGRLDGHDAYLAALDTDKAATGHGHVIADTAGLQDALDGKAPTLHTHTGAQITGGVVKTINSAAPDSAGNISIPTITASTARGDLLAGDGSGGWIVVPARPDTSSGIYHALVSDPLASAGVSWAAVDGADLQILGSRDGVTFGTAAYPGLMTVGQTVQCWRTSDASVRSSDFLSTGSTSSYSSCLPPQATATIAMLPPQYRPTATRTWNLAAWTEGSTGPLGLRNPDGSINTTYASNAATVTINTNGSVTIKNNLAHGQPAVFCWNARSSLGFSI